MYWYVAFLSSLLDLIWPFNMTVQQRFVFTNCRCVRFEFFRFKYVQKNSLFLCFIKKVAVFITEYILININLSKIQHGFYLVVYVSWSFQYLLAHQVCSKKILVWHFSFLILILLLILVLLILV